MHRHWEGILGMDNLDRAIREYIHYRARERADLERYFPEYRGVRWYRRWWYVLWH